MSAVRLFVVAVKVDILIAKLKNYNFYITGIQETKWFNLTPSWVGDR